MKNNHISAEDVGNCWKARGLRVVPDVSASFTMDVSSTLYPQGMIKKILLFAPGVASQKNLLKFFLRHGAPES